MKDFVSKMQGFVLLSYIVNWINGSDAPIQKSQIQKLLWFMILKSLSEEI